MTGRESPSADLGNAYEAMPSNRADSLVSQEPGDLGLIRFLPPDLPVSTMPALNHMGNTREPSQMKTPRSEELEPPRKAGSLAGRKRTGPAEGIKKTPAAKFGMHLEQLVNGSGMTVAEFASKVKKSEQAVWSYFRGTRVPHINDWPRIAKALGLEEIRELVPQIHS